MRSIRELALTWVRPALVVAPALGLVVGLGVAAAGRGELADRILAAATVPVLAALAVQIAVTLRRGETGLDIVALLSMGGALLLGEALAGAVIALMYAGGQYLEAYAERRAAREMTALLGRVPRTAMRYGAGGLAETPIGELVAGDRILVRHGEVVAVDGEVAQGHAALDQSAITGEALPVERGPGGLVLSGSINAGAPFDLLASRPAAESTYAGIVRLVEAARDAKAPIGRLADRYAIVFLAVTVVIAAAAWIASGDPVRALAVLVVATPCPLILAVPVAIIAGVSRAAKRGVLVKGGGALEALARVKIAVVDKTGTLTYGRAELIAIEACPGIDADEALRLAASLDLASNHVVAAALVEAARERGLALTPPEAVEEQAGTGLEGEVEGRRVRLGSLAFVRAGIADPDALVPDPALPPGALTVAVAVDGRAAAVLHLSDGVREDAAQVLEAWRRAGIGRIVLASGDRADIALAVGSELGVDEIAAELSPGDKVTLVLAERQRGPVMMLGDGVNDAPALAAADLGVAMGARGAAASSEAADAVLMVDRLDRLAEAMAIARRALAIARQSVVAGIGLSVLAMGFAAFGYLTPVQGALLQEAIDVAVILNALRALRAPAAER
ncbi:heavy metal translocating P-type ATPase [Ancylobacter terrae]|uniref:heavy metal translocating P-type ATPase n=1 Tax=Ancylobacter sp. sgz301288 TaxID=3342077 RepID=UPI00385E7FBC